ncbi:cohesin domain-containing protein [Halovivax limisalsi]|uniref:cohesin domain-containing protein n=1 Tax=Halovivax limisalsi TaxID=1453760 RepID=UPI001FFC373F|nr:cohesin domain-containing protein [Halovivax limisalsi]
MVGAALGPVGGAVADRTDTIGAADGVAAVEAEQVDGTLSLVSGSSSDGSATVTLETDVEAVAGYQANVTFDPDVVQVESVSGVDMSDPVVNVDNEAGWVSFTQSQATSTEAPTLAEITFDVVESGETELAFVADDSLVNNESTMLAPELDGTTLEVDDSGDGLPGFGPLSALAAVCALLVAASARRD